MTKAHSFLLISQAKWTGSLKSHVVLTQFFNPQATAGEAGGPLAPSNQQRADVLGVKHHRHLMY